MIRRHRLREHGENCGCGLRIGRNQVHPFTDICLWKLNAMKSGKKKELFCNILKCFQWFPYVFLFFFFKFSVVFYPFPFCFLFLLVFVPHATVTVPLSCCSSCCSCVLIGLVVLTRFCFCLCCGSFSFSCSSCFGVLEMMLRLRKMRTVVVRPLLEGFTHVRRRRHRLRWCV